MDIYIEKTTTIFVDGAFSYTVRPNADIPEGMVDIVYKEDDEEIKYIGLSVEVIPSLIEALQSQYDLIQKQGK